MRSMTQDIMNMVSIPVFINNFAPLFAIVIFHNIKDYYASLSFHNVSFHCSYLNHDESK